MSINKLDMYHKPGEILNVWNLRKSKFVHNVAIVAAGTAGAQVIALVFSPIVARLYGPESFGLLGTFMAVVTILSPVAALSFPIAIVLPKKDREAKHIVYLSLYLSLLVAIFIGIILLTGNKWILPLFRMERIASLILLIPLVVVFSAWHEIALQWTIRKKQFKINARAAVAHTLIVNGTKVSVGWFNPAAAVLVVITSFSGLLYSLLLIGIKNLRFDFFKQTPGLKELKKIITKYYDFPLYRSPQIFINSISQSLPVLMLAAYCGPVKAGFFELSIRVLSMPVQLIAKSVSDVLYPRISEAANNGENLTNLILKATLTLAIVGFVPFATIIAFGPWLFGFVFGKDWLMAGEYARWLGLWIFIGFLNKPSITAIPALSMQGYLLGLEVISILLRTAFLYLGFHFFKNDLAAIILFSVAGVLTNSVLIGLTILVSKNRKRAI